MKEQKKRVFIIVLDSVGAGEAPDAADYGDTGSHTLETVSAHPAFYMPNTMALGLADIPGINMTRKTPEEKEPERLVRLPGGIRRGAYGKMKEASCGKDTTTGHWEIAGIISNKPLPAYPDGFPPEVIEAFEQKTGRKTLCNRPYSGTEVIRDYGREHIETGALIVYTSADSVFQIAAHEEVVPLEELYRYCKIARKILTGDHNVGRVIARPFTGTWPAYTRTSGRHDYSVHPPKDTMLTLLQKAGKDVLAVGKILDIFAGDGITEAVRTVSNKDGMEKLLADMDKDFEGLCFVNLVDFDMLYGHRNDVEGYAKALSEFDLYLPGVLEKMRANDLLIITADHGCDPGTPSTDHSREYVPVLIAGSRVKENYALGVRNTFADVAASVLDYLGVPGGVEGVSMWPDIQK